jgi:nitrogen fixation NifU-like protein
VVAQGHNPLCGDEITVYVQVDDDRVSDVKVAGQGCSISQSSASMMSQAIKGKSVPEVRALVRKFKSMMSIEEASVEDDGEPASTDVQLGDLEALQGVVKFPVRIKCATLAWNTLLESLHQAAADPSSQHT